MSQKTYIKAANIAMLVSIAVIFSACGSSAASRKDTASGTHGSAAYQLDQYTRGDQKSNTATGETGECVVNPVYFSFDSSELSSVARDMLSGDARCLKARSGAPITVTGMADSRGTEEYNLALGQKRAKVVVSYMVSLGVDAERLKDHSAGEEYARGTDELGWSLDRRAEFNLR